MNNAQQNWWQRVSQFLFHGIWETDLNTFNRARRIGIRWMRLLVILVRGFVNNQLPIHASALTFASLMSLVPLLAIGFAIMSGMGYGEAQTARLMEWQQGMPDGFREFINRMMVLARRTNFAAMGWVGLVTVLLLAATVLSNIEESFNRIWGITTFRNPFRRAANYISILVVVPILIGLATTLSATLKSDPVVSRFDSAGMLHGMLLHLAPLLACWLAFFFLNAAMPNTKVGLAAALISGFLTAVLFLGWQAIYISFQVGVTSRNAIYGTFASVPIFLAWLYVSWLLVLLGAQIAYAIQNETSYVMEKRAEKAGFKTRLAIGLAALTRAGQALEGMAQPFDVQAFARDNHVPLRLANEMINVFVLGGWFSEMAEQPGCYTLLKAPEKVALKDAYDLILQQGGPDDPGIYSFSGAVKKELGRIEAMLGTGFAGRTLRDVL